MATEVRTPARPATSSSMSRGSGSPVGRPRRRAWLTRTLFLLPAFALFVGLVLLPMALGIYTSLFKWNGFGGLPTNFVGLDNFTRLLDDEVFIGDLKRGLILVV